ncbi:3-oxoacyl-ACP reductase FabG [Slackia heliotrinireducens]|jgi:3-oxoacyl-[acyl-carrier protein] reductase|uniref:3-oxoacyl-ACP reductase FabG n=1 Tax=Slackia heliotrinireducens TaxID=84110 RepID=UPI003314831B
MLTGKTALVTGGSRGIGAAIAQRLASLGANVAVVYAGNREAAEKVCDLCGTHARAYRCDVSNWDEAKATVKAIKDDFGTVDILVNNAGVTRDGLIATMREEDYDAVLDVNLKGAFNMIRHCTGLFIRNRGGSIVNVSSVSGLMGNAGQSNYAASKAGLVGLTKSVAKELAPKGIRCNAVAPGFIQTDMTSDQESNVLLDAIPLGRMGTPADVADAVAYLVCAPYVTGTVLRVDGGIAM